MNNIYMKKFVTIIAISISIILVVPPLHAEGKTYWGWGLGIGMLGGAAVGGTVGALTDKKCTGYYCGDTPDQIGGFVWVTVGLIFGGLIGTGIGATIHKKSSVSITPNILPSHDGKIGGGGIGITGEF